MNPSIELNKLETIPDKTLTILKDDFGKKDIYSLYLKDDISEFPSSLNFRIGFVQVNRIPILIFMVKIKNKIYKNLVSFDFVKELDYLIKLVSLKTFNLFLFTNTNENLVFKIQNKHHKTLSDAISAVKLNMPSNSIYDVTSAKEQLLSTYSDIELWNLAK